MRSVGVGVTALCLAVWLSVGCGAAGVPSGTGTTPIPIELPSVVQLPESLAISVAPVQGAADVSVPLGKTVVVPGETPLQQSVYPTDNGNTRLDAILAVLANVSANSDATVTSASGTTDDGSAWVADFSAAEFPTVDFDTAGFPTLDCSATCSGHTASYPVCMRIWVGGKRAAFFKILSAVDAAGGAGCFYTVSDVTASAASSAALFTGTESYVLAGRWDFRDTASRWLELVSSTTAADAEGVRIDSHHAVLNAATATDATVTTLARLRGQITVGESPLDIEAVHRWTDTLSQSSYTLTNDTTTTDAGCFDLETGEEVFTDVAGCESLTITEERAPEEATPPPLEETVMVATLDESSSSSSGSSSSGGDGGSSSSSSSGGSSSGDASSSSSSSSGGSSSGGGATLPTVAFTATSASGAESTGSVSVQVTLSAASADAVTVAYAVTGGTATGSGTDFTLASGTATISAGSTTTTLALAIVDDAQVESSETVIVTLSNPANATLGTNTSHTYTITDNDTPPGVSSSTPAAGATEVSISSAVEVTFDRAMNAATLTTSTFTLTTGGTPVAASVSAAGTTATLTPTSSLAYNTTHEATLTTGVQDSVGNALSTPTSWSFTTRPAPGSLDTSFNSTGSVETDVVGTTNQNFAYDMARQSDGKLVVVGSTGNAMVLRYTSAGVLDTTFDSDGVVLASAESGMGRWNAVAIQSDGKIVVAGTTSDNADMIIARYTTTGSLDTDFSADGSVTVNINDPTGATEYTYDALIDASGRIVVAGGAGTQTALVRLTSSGALDTTFGGDGIVVTSTFGGDDSAQAIALPASGAGLWAAGRYYDGSEYNVYLMFLNNEGDIDVVFNTDGVATYDVQAGSALNDMVSSMVVQSDGDILIAGSVATTTDELFVLRVDGASNGALDTAFSGDGIFTTTIGTHTTANANDLVVQSDGSMFVVGNAWTNVAEFYYVVAQISNVGVLNTNFDSDGILTIATGGTGTTGEFDAAVLQSDGKLVTAGYADFSSGSNNVVVYRLWP
ncbi:MAG: Ig-like domain-containing protein [Deltaproteobacteria bacterium]|nr:Ig-like domain-containing protein [Deltaproteobacteria bacterium]